MALKIEEVKNIDFKLELQNQSKPIVVYCYDKVSALSKLIENVFLEVAEKYVNIIKFYKMAIEDSKDIFFEYGIMKIPAIVMFKDGELYKKEHELKYDSSLKTIFKNFFSEDITIHSKILKFFDDRNFKQEVLNSELPVLVNYWLPNNELCWTMLKDMEDIYTLFKWKIKIGIIDFKNNNDAVTLYGITQVPTAALFVKGILKDTMIGVRSKKGIINFIKQYVDLGI
ncbi:MAG TPA: thioredoxin domain-containing protein [bacterium]|nr:thioredoxin domain-containing protein [bacterium]HOL46659.1 thioredoxin domain-containing protein [bacterium]HPQ17770.1 thioredoxin domain-containing protein [bacterium]